MLSRVSLHVTSLCTALTLTAAAAAAQTDSARTDSARTLDPIVVTAGRTAARASGAAAGVRVVQGRDIERRAVPDLTVLLREVPGVQLDPVVGSGAGVVLQGLGSDRVLVLIDGSPLAGRLGGQLDLTRLDPSMFERIEIVEGPQSTLYGSSALGGVVNLLTRRDMERRAAVTVQAGAFGQRDARLRLAEPFGATAATVEFGRRTLDLAPGTGPETVGVANRWDGMARVRHDLGPGDLDMRVLGMYDEQRYPSGGATNFNDNWQADALATLALGRAAATEFRTHLSWYDHRLIRSTSGMARDGDPEWDRQRVADVEVLQRGALGPHRWLVGGKLEREWLQTDRIAEGSRAAWSGAPYVSADWSVTAGVRVNTGLRLTAAEVWGTNLAPRIGVTARHASGVYGKAGLARGFRAPSSKEQFFEFVNVGPGFSYMVLGSEDLVPETSWNATVEAGVVARAFRVHARAFGNTLDNFIETAPAGDSAGIPIFRYQNIGEARTAGLDLGAEATWSALTLSVSWAALYTEDRATGDQLLGRAAQQLRGAVGYDDARFSVRPEVVHASRVPVSRAADGTTQYQGPFTHVNLSADVRPLDMLRIGAGVDNVFDTEPAGAILHVGRRWFARLTWGIGR